MALQNHLQVKEVLDILLKMETVEGTLLTKIVPSTILNTIAIKLVAEMHKSNQDMVTEFNDTFNVKKVKDIGNDVNEFLNIKELRLRLIIEETVKLAFALGFSELKFKMLVAELVQSVYSNPPYTDSGESYTETFDALLDLLYVTYGALDVFNLADKTLVGMVEVHSSNMSKLCANEEVLRATVAKYQEEGIILETHQQPDGRFVVKNHETKKVLKSVDYRSANLKQFLY